MREASIVKSMYKYTFKLYIGPYTIGCGVLIYIYVYKFIYYAAIGNGAGWGSKFAYARSSGVFVLIHILHG